MARWTASAKWAAGPALDGQCATLLGLALSEGLGFSERGKRAGCILMLGIVLPALRHCKSGRGTPRLRRLPRILHGAVRLAAQPMAMNSEFGLIAEAHDARHGQIPLFCGSSEATAERSVTLLPIAASGGFLVRLDWPALTPVLTQIRLFALAWLSALARHRVGPGCEVNGCVVAVQFTPTGALPTEATNGGLSEA